MDLAGIFIPDKEYILGLKSVKAIDQSKSDKRDNGRNTKEAIDCKLYELRNFLNLALSGNPNILEILFSSDNAIQEIDGYGQLLRSNKHLFLSQLCLPRFLGYSKAQKHKMIIKKDNYHDLLEGYEFLKEQDPKTCIVEVFNKQKTIGKSLFYKKNQGQHIFCGDMCFEPGVYAKKALRILKDRIDKATNRTDLILKHGYDVKFGSHLIRLLLECISILEEETLRFPLSEAKLVRAIKEGEISCQAILSLAKELEEQIVKLKKNKQAKEQA